MKSSSEGCFNLRRPFSFALFLRFGAGLPLVWYRRRQGVNRAAWAVFAPLWGMPSKGRGGSGKI